jgi:hypothetical protein
MGLFLNGVFTYLIYCSIFIFPVWGLVHDFYKAFYITFILAFFAAMLNEVIQVLKDIRDK